jgi:ribosomal protein S8E
VSKKTRVLDVTYNASNNELVRRPPPQIAAQRARNTRFRVCRHARRSLSLLTLFLSALQVRTQTLVKGAVVQVDATPFRSWYAQHYGAEVGIKKGVAAAKAKEGEAAAAKPSAHVVRKHDARVKAHKPLDPLIEEQMTTGRLYAVIASRPGQCGRVDGYILEGKELEFYAKKMAKKKGGASAKV